MNSDPISIMFSYAEFHVYSTWQDNLAKGDIGSNFIAIICKLPNLIESSDILVSSFI